MISSDCIKKLKKKGIDKSFLFVEAVMGFETNESGDVMSEARNICFEYLGASGSSVLLTNIPSGDVQNCTNQVKSGQVDRDLFVSLREKVEDQLFDYYESLL